MLTYTHPPGVRLFHLHNRPILSTSQGGYVALDPVLLALWQHADGSSLAQIVDNFEAEYATSLRICSALACLAEAGLLLRQGVSAAQVVPSPALWGRLPSEPASRPQVAAVIVNYHSRAWLSICIPSLLAQTYSPLEIIVVDNGSHDGCLDWLAEAYPAIKRLQIERPLSLAAAINRGVEQAAPGAYLWVLNPDIRLEPDALAQMMAVAQSDPLCAAVAAKLYFSWAPPFLNGLGNQVGAFSWGTDNALGHLDLGQFDGYRELPSACFAATLITPSAWQLVGCVDAAFPMYYEDAEWCYRARLLGHKVLAAPKAIVYHAFGGAAAAPGGASDAATVGEDGQPPPNLPSADGLSPQKQANVVYGRLRFSLKLLGKYLPRFLFNYLAEDGANIVRHIGMRHWKLAGAFPRGWGMALNKLPDILRQRHLIQSHRIVADDELFSLQRTMPVPISWSSLPELTWDLILHYYAPLIEAGRTRPMPEFTPDWNGDSHRPHVLILSPVDQTVARRTTRLNPPEPVEASQTGTENLFLEMARALSHSLDVTLALPSDLQPASASDPSLRLVRYWAERPANLQLLIENCDIAILPAHFVNLIPTVQQTPTRLVISLHGLAAPDPHPLPAGELPDLFLQVGDFYLCEDESQRQAWQKALAFYRPAIAGKDGRPPDHPNEVRFITCLGSAESPLGFEAPLRIEALRQYCLQGGYAADRDPRPSMLPPLRFEAPLPTGRVARAFYIWRTQGFRMMLHRTLRFLVWRLSRG